MLSVVAFVNGLGAVSGFQIFASVFKKVRGQVVARVLNAQREGCFPCRRFFRGIDLALFLHAMKNQIAACQGARRIRQRRIFRAIDHSGQQRGFLQLQVRYRFAKVEFGGGRKTVIAVRQIHLIRVHGEDLRLGVPALDLQGQQRFLHLAAKADFAAVEKQIAGQLHGDGAGALNFAALKEFAAGGTRDARKVDAPVLLVVLVFDGGDRVVEHLGALLVRHQDAALQGKAADKLPVIGVNLGDHVGAIGLQRANLRQVAGVHKEQPASRAQRNRAEQEKRQRHPVNQFPTAQPQRNRRQTQHEPTILAQMNGLADRAAFSEFPSSRTGDGTASKSLRRGPRIPSHHSRQSDPLE